LLRYFVTCISKRLPAFGWPPHAAFGRDGNTFGVLRFLELKLNESRKKKLVPIMIRLEPDHAECVRNLAHSARLPISIYCKNLVVGRMPVAAPPALEDLSCAANRLLQICQSAASNFTQLQTHAAESSDNRLKRLIDENVISSLQGQVRSVGMEIKLGRMTGAQIDQILPKFEAPMISLNDLARALNEGREVSVVSWGQVLRTVKEALS
jgi:hypothetical protein